MLGHITNWEVYRLTGLGTEKLFLRHIVRLEDFVLPLAQGGDDQDEPLLVRVVLPCWIDATRDVVRLEVLLEFLDQNGLRGRSHADPEEHLVLRHLQYLSLLDLAQGLLADVLRAVVGQVSALAHLLLPVGPDVLVHDRVEVLEHDLAFALLTVFGLFHRSEGLSLINLNVKLEKFLINLSLKLNGNKVRPPSIR